MNFLIIALLFLFTARPLFFLWAVILQIHTQSSNFYYFNSAIRILILFYVVRYSFYPFDTDFTEIIHSYLFAFKYIRYCIPCLFIFMSGTLERFVTKHSFIRA